MIEITDEMVDRACKAHWGRRLWKNGQPTAPRLETAAPMHDMHAALDAALNPPAEMDVVVTEEMVEAGRLAYNDLMSYSGGIAPPLLQRNEVYRAMRRLEPVPPFTEKMQAAMLRALPFSDELLSKDIAEAYRAARDLEGK